MTDLYSLYQSMKEDDIILAYRGNFSAQMMDTVFGAMESRMDGEKIELRMRRRINTILVECLQNVYRHMEATPGKTPIPPDRQAMFVVSLDARGTVQVLTGNPVRSEDVPAFRQKLDRVNALTGEELTAFYRESLDKARLSEKGGAGLGLIEIARKSGHPIEYRFDAMDASYMYFSQRVTVDF
jgi:hypothetical protein